MNHPGKMRSLFRQIVNVAAEPELIETQVPRPRQLLRKRICIVFHGDPAFVTAAPPFS